jgi:hypothetical protein
MPEPDPPHPTDEPIVPSEPTPPAEPGGWTTPPPPPPPPPEGPAWERQGPIFGRVIDTARDVLFHPQAFFRAMPRTAGLGPSLTFYLLTGIVGLIASALFQFVISSAGHRDQMFLGGIFLLATIVLGPVMLIIGAFIGSGIYHLMLMLFGAARHPFETTFRVVTYSAGAASLLAIIPFCGGVVGGIWQIVAIIIGLTEAHETTTGKAAAAVLIPLAICCAFIGSLIAFAIVFGVVAGMAHGMSGAGTVY